MSTQLLPKPHPKFGMFDIEEALRNAAHDGDVTRIVELQRAYPNLDLNAANENGETAIYLAAKQGKLDAVTYLTKQPGIDVNTQTHLGNSPLAIAAWKEQPDIARVLLKAGADFSLRTSADRKYHGGMTALDVAKDREHPELIRILTAAAEAKIPQGKSKFGMLSRPSTEESQAMAPTKNSPKFDR